ncbi:MAG: hypothetical protein HQ536_05035 [Parcubacteria group bacterium]|nr:hypothetical protein [Parcubacteria group bacterium]
MPEINKPKLANCSPRDVFKALRKLGDFKIKEGAKHSKIIYISSGKASVLPRHKIINKHLLKDFVEDYLVKELDYSEKEIYKYLRCQW